MMLLEDGDFNGDGTATVRNRRADHIRTVLKAGPGDCLKIGKLGGKLGEGRIVRVDGACVELQVQLSRPPPPPLDVTLLLALPRPKCLRRIVQGVVTLGVKRLALFGAYRVEKAYWSTPWLNEASLGEQVRLGLEQAGDTVPPVITTHRLFKPFIEDTVPELVSGRRRLLADPGACEWCPCGDGEPTVLAVGPEGGFTAYELAAWGESGFLSVGLGPRILRTEQAVPALIGRLMAGRTG